MKDRDPSAIFVPSAEWQGLDLTDEQKDEWMTQVEPPPMPATLSTDASESPQPVAKIGAWLPMSAELLADSLDLQRDVLDRVWAPWKFPDRDSWPTLVPFPRLAAFQRASSEGRLRLRTA